MAYPDQLITRREFIHGCSAASLAIYCPTSAWGRNEPPDQPSLNLDDSTLLNHGWQFQRGSTGAFAGARPWPITLPHCVTPLSWRKWDPVFWEDVWTYRRSFDVPAHLLGRRLFLHFDRVMAAATVSINSHSLPQHLGGFLPFEYEVTEFVRRKENVLIVMVDARWINAPPSGSPQGPSSIDYLLPGGITGAVTLRASPPMFATNIFTKPVDILDPHRRIEVSGIIDARSSVPTNVRVETALRSGKRILSQSAETVAVEKQTQQFRLTIGDLGQIVLWDVENPQLYHVDISIFHNHIPIHRCTTRIGLREARFETDGFFLNGRRLRLFGLNRHELYPYIGFAAPDRLLRRDAEILRHKFNCNIVRCSHYPQSPAFLDACDELGLMVWEELPGWQFIGDRGWRDLAVRDVENMVRRDRNHPSIVIWGVRINESHNHPELYSRTRSAAKSLDDSRPTSGTMTMLSTADWHQDVYAYDDYHASSDHSVDISASLPGVPFMISETVGQFNYSAAKGFDQKYRRAGDPAQQVSQAIWHAQAHDRAARDPRCAGAIAWCAFDYGSLMNAHEAVKCPGVADVFRIPKLGAAFYLAQIDPSVRPVIEPDFHWDFGPQTPSGPGERAAIFSNCDRLELLIDGKSYSTLHPDRAGFPNSQHPPFFANLEMNVKGSPELCIDGYMQNKRVISRSFSCDHYADRLHIQADDRELKCDGSDATRLLFGVVDKFGTPRAFAGGDVVLTIEGPGLIIGDNPFDLGDSGGMGAVWIRSIFGHAGWITLRMTHSSLGVAAARIFVDNLK